MSFLSVNKFFYPFSFLPFSTNFFLTSPSVLLTFFFFCIVFFFIWFLICLFFCGSSCHSLLKFCSSLILSSVQFVIFSVWFSFSGMRSYHLFFISSQSIIFFFYLLPSLFACFYFSTYQNIKLNRGIFSHTFSQLHTSPQKLYFI